MGKGDNEVRKKKDHGKHVSTEYCHNCGKNMRIVLDLNLNGNHVIKCPHCDHEHCRVIEGGKITGVRWAQRNGGGWGQGVVYLATVYASTSATTGSTYTSAQWASSDSTGGGYWG